MPWVETFCVDAGDHRPVTPAQVHGLVTTFLERGWSEADHGAGRKGFTTSLPVHVDTERWRIRVAAIDDTLRPRLLEGIERGVDVPFELGRGRKGRTAVDPDPMHQSVIVGWGELLDDSRPATSFPFQFLTPTAFRSGRTYNPLPHPPLVFGHLRDRWSAFAPDHLRPDIELKPLGLAIESFNGHTEVVQVRSIRSPGFVGTATLVATRARGRDRRVLDALARLAPFAGIGTNTTVGMGTVTYLG